MTDFLVLSHEKPPEKPSKNDKGKPLTWDQVVAKLLLRGLSPRQIGQMTMKQAYLALDEMTEELKTKARIAGCKVEDDDDHVATLQDLLGLGM